MKRKFFLMFVVLVPFFLILISGNMNLAASPFVVSYVKNFTQEAKFGVTYTLIDTVDFEFSSQNLPQFYSGINENDGIAFSIEESNASINYSLSITDTKGREQVSSGGVGGNSASDKSLTVAADLNSKDTYEFKCFPYDEVYKESKRRTDTAFVKVNIYAINRW